MNGAATESSESAGTAEDVGESNASEGEDSPNVDPERNQPSEDGLDANTNRDGPPAEPDDGSPPPPEEQMPNIVGAPSETIACDLDADCIAVPAREAACCVPCQDDPTAYRGICGEADCTESCDVVPREFVVALCMS